MLRVGLTGGIGAGKSEVSRRLQACGALVIDSDILARQVVTPGSDGLAEVVAAFGKQVLRDDGTLDRTALGARVFADEAARRRLEDILHPRIRAQATQAEKAAGPHTVVVHDIPLLIETNRQGDYDVVVVVDVPERAQVDRLVRTRNMSEAEAWSRIRSQAPRAQRLAEGHIVIDNTGSLTELDAAVADLWRALLARAGAESGC